MLLFPFSSWAGRHTEESRAAPTPPREPWLHQTWGAQEEWAHTSHHCPALPGIPALLPASVSPYHLSPSSLATVLLPFSATLVKASLSGAGDRVTKDNLAPSLPALRALFSQPWLPPWVGPSVSPHWAPLSACRSGWPACCVIGLLGSAGSDLSCFGPGAFPLQPTLHSCRQALAQHFLTATHPPSSFTLFLYFPAFSQTRGLFCMHEALCLACLTIQPDTMIH